MCISKPIKKLDNKLSNQMKELKSIEEITYAIISQNNFNSMAADSFVNFMTETNALILELILVASARQAVSALRSAKDKGITINFMQVKLECWAQDFLVLHERDMVELNIQEIQRYLPREYKINPEFILAYKKKVDERRYKDQLSREINTQTITEIMTNHQSTTFYAYVLEKYPFINQVRDPNLSIAENLVQLFNNKIINLTWDEYQVFLYKYKQKLDDLPLF